MKRPLLLRLAPAGLRESLFYRLYNPAQPKWHRLFHCAELRFAPGVTMRLVPTDVLHGCIALTGAYDSGLSRRVVSLGRRGGLMVDVGANAGYFSLLWLAAGMDSRVIAFEPSARNVELFGHNTVANGFGDRVEMHTCAAGREDGVLEFEPGPEEQTGWGGVSVRQSETSYTVQVRTVDSAVASGSRVSLLKIDAEGADTWVLLGCERLLRERRVDELHFEQNKPRMRALGIGETTALQFLRECGYAAVPTGDPRKDVVNWAATRG